ncbi:hypothetical protein [Anaeromyxobacter oryzae]|uniref:VWFA domain-containing protein n=1 Tax=Anaeromyxobacter oryzae TaxID=2918170 RepID=A0ABM7WQ27_9BACT|nr:hypothetical protein [Anaeromyxobacter oryzae]BDG01569.1 hypothetical protein AMOR_05650 [Anaeromyxobacter oryzae]
MRPSRVRTLMLLALSALAAGCQDYNFNPVGHCLIQPGQQRITLSNLSTADVLFVVDDSGSMGGEQQKLADNFAAFISNLNQTNVDRRAAGLEPIDFHLAVTTTSIFISNPTSATCRNDCPGVTGTNVCCENTGSTPVRPLKQAKSCNAASDCASGYCGTDCVGLLGEKVCCDPATKLVGTTDQANVACSAPGAACGSLQKHYRVDSSCAAGLATNGQLYPHGAFVGASNNPRVLHFDKEVYPELDATTGQPKRDPALPACSDGSKTCNRQGYTAAQLEGWFKANVVAGTCGSGEEQGLQAGRLAVQKALAGQQLDLRPDGSALPADWPHANSKLVLVFLGDEDDCSSPEDAVGGIILSGSPGADTCVADASMDDGVGKHFAVTQVVDYFAGLNRPLGAAFIVSANSETCQDQSCVAGVCCDFQCTGTTAVCTSDVCGGQAAGNRFLGAANNLRQKGADVVVGSMCNPNFGTILTRIADIVKPPSGLVLPSDPAGTEITILRIADATGKTRKTCKGPAPSTLSAADAAAQGWDWWFTATRDQLADPNPSTVSRFVYINHATQNCEANPGETYSADYLGRLPAGGCQSRAACYRDLGGVRPTVVTATNPELWTCYAGETPAGFVQPTPDAPGTCLCGDLGTGSY